MLKTPVIYVLLIISLLSASTGASKAADLEPVEEINNALLKQQVADLLDQFHLAAKNANGKLYFSLFAQDGQFIGTDPDEIWNVEAFKQYAMPYFNQGKGWEYEPLKREIHFSSRQDTVWFVESLHNDKYGQCRGSGVLELIDGQWKIAQYNLSFPIPNALSQKITSEIKQFKDE